MPTTDEQLKDIKNKLEESHAAHLQHRRPPRNINQETQASFSTLERIAILVTEWVGTFGFFLIVFFWTVIWLLWNMVAPSDLRFDPAPAFVLWLFISNMIQIFLMPLIMVGQNLQGRHAELRAENDFEINKKAEQEVETILLHLKRQELLIRRHEERVSEALSRLEAQLNETPAMRDTESTS